MTDPGDFWHYWAADQQLPANVVLRTEDVKNVLGVDSFGTELLAEVDMREKPALSHIAADEVTTKSSTNAYSTTHTAGGV